MEIIRTEQLDFTYSGANEKALDNINFCIESGEIVTLCGASGCGKSTLLRNLKKVIAPFGTKKGNIFYKGTLLENVQEDIQVREIGFVSQSADNQIVTDRVYHELSFGLESLGYDNDIIRRRVGEIATFFGITDWFYKDVNELSGGQKQILCLASIMTMLPQVIILDEPTSQLDTIAAGEFVNMLLKINRELGITIIITEHRLDEILPYSDRVIVMDKGKIVANDTPDKVCLELREMKHRMFLSMPVPVRIWNGCNNSGNKCPLTINEGRKWLENYVREQDICIVNDKTDRELNKVQYNEYALRARELWFKYDKNGKDILKGVNLNVKLGEIYGILGGNGAGKSTLLSLLCGNRSAYRGKIKCEGRVCMLPQDPKSLFVKKTVRDELEEVVEIKKSHGSNASKNVERCEKEFDECELGNIIKVCRLNELLERNPYDLSGGEQQRVALAKIMLTNPEIILLDEPTKGLDNEYKLELGKMLREMTMRGKTIIMVSHDIEFCGEWTDRCGLFFDGNIISEAGHREFFSNNSFYTTATNRMARNVIDNAIVPSDIVDIYAKSACLKTKQCIENYEKNDDIENYEKNDKQENIEEKKENANYRQDNIRKEKDNINYKKENELDDNNILKSRIDKRFLITAIMIIVAIPFTIYAGIYCFDDRKYLFISLLVLLECIAPFFVIYEGRNPSARELVTISVLCAMCIAGRIASYMFPQFKPVMAIVILSGAALGAEVGFLVGAVTMLVSNIIFGQGPWTPWQMFAMGMVGFIAGLMFHNKKNGNINIIKKLSLSAYGLVASIVIYGGIMNPSSAIMAHAKLNKATIITYYVAGFPMDLIQGVATVVFIFLLAKPMLEKIARIKIKYGIRL